MAFRTRRLWFLRVQREKLRGRLVEKPDDPVLLEKLGLIYFEERNFTQATSILQAALSSLSLQALICLGKCLYELDEIVKSQSILSRAHQLFTENSIENLKVSRSLITPSFYNYYIRICKRIDDRKTAKLLITEILYWFKQRHGPAVANYQDLRNGGSVGALLILAAAICRDFHWFEDGLRLLELAHVYSSDNESDVLPYNHDHVWIEINQIYKEKGESYFAEKALEQMAADSECSEIWHEIALLHERYDNVSSALRCFEEANLRRKVPLITNECTSNEIVDHVHYRSAHNETDRTQYKKTGNSYLYGKNYKQADLNSFLLYTKGENVSRMKKFSKKDVLSKNSQESGVVKIVYEKEVWEDKMKKSFTKRKKKVQKHKTHQVPSLKTTLIKPQRSTNYKQGTTVQKCSRAKPEPRRIGPLKVCTSKSGNRMRPLSAKDLVRLSNAPVNAKEIRKLKLKSPSSATAIKIQALSSEQGDLKEEKNMDEYISVEVRILDEPKTAPDGGECKDEEDDTFNKEKEEDMSKCNLSTQLKQSSAVIIKRENHSSGEKSNSSDTEEDERSYGGEFEEADEKILDFLDESFDPLDITEEFAPPAFENDIENLFKDIDDDDDLAKIST